MLGTGYRCTTECWVLVTVVPLNVGYWLSIAIKFLIIWSRTEIKYISPLLLFTLNRLGTVVPLNVGYGFAAPAFAS